MSFHHQKLGQVGVGICMDINPYQFKTDFNAFEWATFQDTHKSKILLLSNAWLKQENETRTDLTIVSETIQYWAMRMSPLIKSSIGTDIIVCISNRTGIER
jgi:protein N-terminal amidase